MECPACSNTRGNKPVDGHAMIETCGACNAIFGECYLGDSYGLVRPHMTTENVPPEKIRYFDFTTVGSAGVARRHGWYDPTTRLVVQTG